MLTDSDIKAYLVSILVMLRHSNPLWSKDHFYTRLNIRTLKLLHTKSQEQGPVYFFILVFFCLSTGFKISVDLK